MKTKSQEMATERKTLHDAATSIIDSAKSDSRELTAAEQRDVKDALARIEEIDAWTEKAKASTDLLARIGGLKEGHLDDDRHGNLFNESDAEGFAKAAKSKTNFGTTINFKAAHTIGTELLPPVGQEVLPAVNVNASFSLRDLFRVAPASSGVVRYYTITNPDATDVAIVAEGGLKPEAEVTYAPVDKELVKLATRFSITDELAEDAPFLVQEIQQSVLRAVLARENKLIIDTMNATSGILTGTGDPADMLDILAEEIGASEAVNGVTPTVAVLNPTDLAAVRQAKASTGGSYFLDPLGTGPGTVHGVRMLSTPATAPGTMWLLTSGFGTFYTRGSLRVEAGFTGDDWIYNRMTVRAEERVLPVVQRPTFVTKITLAA